MRELSTRYFVEPGVSSVQVNLYMLREPVSGLKMLCPPRFTAIGARGFIAAMR